MNEIRCPKCGEVFQIDESNYESIVRQVRDHQFTEELKKFKQNLDKARDDKKLDDYAYRSILDLFNKVAVAITEGKEEIYRETEAIMGGQVLEYEAKTILNQGKAETKNEDIKSLAEYFVKETPTLSYEDAVKMAESILNK